MVSRIAAACLAMLLVAPVARAQVAAPAKPADAVRAEFDAASAEMKRIVGEAAILQAKWHQPNADKAAIEGKFTALESEGRAAGRRLEAAALGMVKVDPKNADARKICNAAAAAALQGDDPQRALAGAQAAADAGAAEPDVMLVAATAATILSQLDEAEAWIKKAVAAGVPAERTAELERGIAASREKVAAEMKHRETDAAADLPRVKIETTAGDVVVELFEDDAPNTVANFVSLVEKGFYDGTPFHRVIPGFMAQGGDPTGSGRGGPGYAIACECALPTARKHFLGSLSMAHAGPNTGGSQFFLTFVPTEHLDGKHTVFGRVIEGFDVLPLITRTQDSQGRTIAGIEPATITKASMVRKRNHPYEPKTLPDPRK